MDQKTKGAWLVHHADKLQNVAGSSEFEQIEAAGKCGQLLSGLAASEEATLSLEKVRALAKGLNINTKLVLPTLLQTLKDRRLIASDSREVQVLGLTSEAVLHHTAEIFDTSEATSSECAALELCEQVSKFPLKEDRAKEYLSDSFELSATETSDLLRQAEECGFTDSEIVDSTTKIFFNGNLFKRDTAGKIKKVIDSLSSDEVRKIQELEQRLIATGCLEESIAKKLLGDNLYAKACAIGMLDINEVSNESSCTRFVTRPAAFNKFGDSLVEDAFDLAKAFVASLTYGMSKSDYERGRISMVGALLRKLINGGTVGPVRAIGQDYRILEYKGVVEITDVGNGKYSMRLLKKEVGEIALKVVSQGDASDHSLLNLPQAPLTAYIGPEINRRGVRKHQVAPSKRESASILLSLRTGGQL